MCVYVEGGGGVILKKMAENGIFYCPEVVKRTLYAGLELYLKPIFHQAIFGRIVST